MVVAWGGVEEWGKGVKVVEGQMSKFWGSKAQHGDYI